MKIFKFVLTLALYLLQNHSAYAQTNVQSNAALPIGVYTCNSETAEETLILFRDKTFYSQFYSTENKLREFRWILTGKFSYEVDKNDIKYIQGTVFGMTTKEEELLKTPPENKTIYLTIVNIENSKISVNRRINRTIYSPNIGCTLSKNTKAYEIADDLRNKISAAMFGLQENENLDSKVFVKPALQQKIDKAIEYINDKEAYYKKQSEYKKRHVLQSEIIDKIRRRNYEELAAGGSLLAVTGTLESMLFVSNAAKKLPNCGRPTDIDNLVTPVLANYNSSARIPEKYQKNSHDATSKMAIVVITIIIGRCPEAMKNFKP